MLYSFHIAVDKTGSCWQYAQSRWNEMPPGLSHETGGRTINK